VIDDERPSFAFDERVFVMPEPIGPTNLAIDESQRRLPDRDLALPANGDSMQPQPIVDP